MYLENLFFQTKQTFVYNQLIVKHRAVRAGRSSFELEYVTNYFVVA